MFMPCEMHTGLVLGDTAQDGWPCVIFVIFAFAIFVCAIFVFLIFAFVIVTFMPFGFVIVAGDMTVVGFASAVGFSFAAVFCMLTPWLATDVRGADQKSMLGDCPGTTFKCQVWMARHSSKMRVQAV